MLPGAPHLPEAALEWGRPGPGLPLPGLPPGPAPSPSSPPYPQSPPGQEGVSWGGLLLLAGMAGPPKGSGDRVHQEACFWVGAGVGLGRTDSRGLTGASLGSPCSGHLI